MTLDIKLDFGMYSSADIKYAAWVGNELKIGVGVHALTLDKDEGERLWDLLGGNAPDTDKKDPEANPGGWREDEAVVGKD